MPPCRVLPLSEVLLSLAFCTLRADGQLPRDTAESRWCAEGRAARQAAPPVDLPYTDLARRVPGYAGHIVAGDTLVLRLVNPAHRTAAEAAVRCFEPALSAAAPYLAVQRARYSLAQLIAWRDQLRKAPPPGATTLSIDETRNQLEVGFPDSAAFSAGRRAMRRLGIPASAVTLIVSVVIDF